jgi:tRNA dimethylallyltransferase
MSLLVSQDSYPLVAVVGPTGSGKSELALRLAESFRGEILNCDSVQVYRNLDVGSAKTPAARRFGIPHHLLDIAAPDEQLTAGEYARRASEALRDIRSRGALPVMAGGTGFYLRALLAGLSPAPAANDKLRARLAAVARRRPTALHRFLRQRDAAAARAIHPNDHQKLMRAIELAGRIPPPRQALQGFRVLKIGLSPERSRLYEKLNQRAAEMFETGLLAETQGLLDSGVSPKAKALESLGYRQAVKVLTLGMPVAEAIAECQLRTRHYAKRQMTWFRAEPDVHYFNGFGSDAEVQQEAASLVRAFLAECAANLD